MLLSQQLQMQYSFFQYLDFFARILLACLCGGLIGYERSKRFKEAGVRTHVVVCLAASLMMIISKYAFADLAGPAGVALFGTRGADPARIAAQVVTGISFLGAGVIFKHGETVTGLTTAAGLWATAGIGMAMGAGMYILGAFAAVTILVFQVVMHRFHIGGDSMFTSHLMFILESDASFEQRLDSFLQERRISVSDMKITYLRDGLMSYDMVVRMPYTVPAGALSQFLHDEGHVQQISFTTAG